MIIELEIPGFVFRHLTSENVDSFLDGAPRDIVAKLQQIVDSLPADNDDEAREGFVSIGGEGRSALTDEEILQAQAEANRAERRGVRIFREAVARRASRSA